MNLVGTYNVLRLAAARIARAEPVEGERGAIVLTASVAAFDGQIGQTSYTAAKAAVHGITLVAARDLASRLIRVNTIAPGVFDTPMLARLRPDIREALERACPIPVALGRRTTTPTWRSACWRTPTSTARRSALTAPSGCPRADMSHPNHAIAEAYLSAVTAVVADGRPRLRARRLVVDRMGQQVNRGIPEPLEHDRIRHRQVEHLLDQRAEDDVRQVDGPVQHQPDLRVG